MLDFVNAKKNKPETSESYAREIARECLKKASGAQQAAIRMMVERAGSDAALFRAIAWPLVEGGVAKIIGDLCRSERQTNWQGGPAFAPNEAARIKRIGASNLMMFRLPGSYIPMKDAKREDLAKAIELCSTTAKDLLFKTRWFQAIRDALPDGKRVGEALTETRLGELQMETKNG